MTGPRNGDRHDPPKCGARRRQAEGSCGQAAGWGTSTPGIGPCKLHGGSTRSHRVRAETTRAHRTLAELTEPVEGPLTDPLGELLMLAAEVVRWKALIAGKLGSLEDLTVGEAAVIRGEVILWERALDRCAHVLAAIAKLNIEERLATVQVRLAERQGEQAALVVFWALEEFGINLSERGAREVVARQMRRLVDMGDREIGVAHADFRQRLGAGGPR
jgi:hypothetical protein